MPWLRDIAQAQWDLNGSQRQPAAALDHGSVLNDDIIDGNI